MVITGVTGLLGRNHAETLIDGITGHHREYVRDDGYVCDVTNRESVETLCSKIVNKYDNIDALINNTANNPKVEGNAGNMQPIRFVYFPIEMWMDDIAVGLKGALICL